MESTQHVTLPDEENTKFREEWGGYNDPPPGLKEITSDRFGAELTREGLRYIEFRQFRLNGEGPYVQAKLFHFYGGQGVVVTSSYERVTDTPGKLCDHRSKFWIFGCDHKWGSVDFEKHFNRRPFRCESAIRCQYCGRVRTIDSSD